MKSGTKLWVLPTSAEHKKNTKDPSSLCPAKVHRDSRQSECDRDRRTSLTLILVMMIILSLHLGYKFMLLIAGRPLQRLTEMIRGKKKKEIPDLSERSCSDREHGFLFNTKTDFPQLPTNKAGIPPCPTEPSASRKVQSQWEIPFSFHPRHAPTATLASGTSAPVPAPVQRKELHTDSAADTSLVLQRASNLLADFPPLLPPREPFSSGVKCVTGNPMVQSRSSKKRSYPLAKSSPRQCDYPQEKSGKRAP